MFFLFLRVPADQKREGVINQLDLHEHDPPTTPPGEMKSMHACQVALALLALCNAVQGETDQKSPHEDFTVKVSPECAAVVLVGSGVAGTVAVTTMLWPLITSMSLLCSGGLCAAGVKGGTIGWLSLVA